MAKDSKKVNVNDRDQYTLLTDHKHLGKKGTRVTLHAELAKAFKARKIIG